MIRVKVATYVLCVNTIRRTRLSVKQGLSVRLSVCDWPIRRTIHPVGFTLGRFAAEGPATCSVEFGADLVRTAVCGGSWLQLYGLNGSAD